MKIYKNKFLFFKLGGGGGPGSTFVIYFYRSYILFSNFKQEKKIFNKELQFKKVFSLLAGLNQCDFLEIDSHFLKI